MEEQNFLTDIKHNSNNYKSDLLESLRDKSLKNLEVVKYPTKKNDDWKYSNLAKALGGDSQIKTPQTLNPTIVFEETDSFYEFKLTHPLNMEDINKIEIATNFKLKALRDIKDSDILTIIDKDTYYSDEFLTNLNNSYFDGGILIEVKKDTSIDKPILISHNFIGKQVHHCYQTCILVGNNSKVSLLEKLNSNGEESFINYKAHVLLKENSNLSHTIHQDNHKEDTTTLQVNAHTQKNSHYNNCILNTGSKFSRSNLFMNLSEENSTVDAHGLYILDGNQHHDTMSFIKHSAPLTFSNQLYKGIINDTARGIFTGKVRVEKDAQQINANQLNKNLLLGIKAHANSRPQMEIYADDVKCAHGSTTGQISEEELFYFTARGIKPEVARSMMAQGYSNDVILKITDLTIMKYIMQTLNKQQD